MLRKIWLKPWLGLLLVITLVIPAASTPALADNVDFPLEPGDEIITAALDYLAEIQEADGSIGGYANSSWVVMAIAAAGEDPDGFGSPSVVDYVRDNADQIASEFNMGTALARIVLTAVAVCEDPSAFGPGDTNQAIAPGGDYLAALKALHNGEQFTDGYGTTDMINDDVWGLMALIAAGEPPDSPLVTSTVDFIVAAQGFDGGWSWATPGNAWYWGSDVDDTAAALIALGAAGYSEAAVIDSAMQYIQLNQGPNGGFQYDSFSVENVASTTWAVGAIVAAGQDPTGAEWSTLGNDPIDYLLSMQEEAGSFPYADPLPEGYLPMREKNTAEAIIALTGNYYPVIPECPDYVFTDPRRGTEMSIIDSDAGTFRFTAPDGYDSGVVKARRMRVTKQAIIIIHRDREMAVIFQANIKRDWAHGILFDRTSRSRYRLFDPFGFE